MGEEVIGYKPPADFEANAKDPLVDFNMTDSTELWLIQWPKNQNPDYDGQELTLKLHGDGKLGSFEAASGKEYDLVSYASQESNATVFVSSASGTKIAGKISRRVSLVHYPEPSELKEREEFQMSKSWRKSQISSSMGLTNSSQRTPSRSTRTTTTATPTRSVRPTTTTTPSTSTFQRSSHSHKRQASLGRSHSSGVTSSGQDGSTTTTTSGERSSKKSKEKY